MASDDRLPIRGAFTSVAIKNAGIWDKQSTRHHVPPKTGLGKMKWLRDCARWRIGSDGNIRVDGGLRIIRFWWQALQIGDFDKSSSGCGNPCGGFADVLERIGESDVSGYRIVARRQGITPDGHRMSHKNIQGRSTAVSASFAMLAWRWMALHWSQAKKL